MGIFTIKARFYNPEELERSLVAEAWVDTGATFTGLPISTLRGLGLEPRWRGRARLADGREVEREFATIGLELEGQVGEVAVVFKEEGSPPVLGAEALETLGFWVDPIERKLIPKPPWIKLPIFPLKGEPFFVYIGVDGNLYH